MAITFSEGTKRKNYLVLILGILILILVLIFAWRIFSIQIAKRSATIIQKSPEIKINLEILESPILKDFQPFEEIKPFEESVGRENPFLPY